MSAKAKIRGAVSKALGVLKSFTLTFDMAGLSVQLGVDPQVGAWDSGILSSDLTALLVAMGEAAREEKTAVLIAIDELQYLNEEQLAAIIMAVHRVTQLALPLLVVGTGLPQLPALAGNAKSYAERLFDYPDIGALSRKRRLRPLGSRREARASTLTTQRSSDSMKLPRPIHISFKSGRTGFGL